METARTAPLPLVALTAGDVAGIGPEIVATALADERVLGAARVLAIGPDAVRPANVPLFDEAHQELGACAWLAIDGPDEWLMGEAQEACGQAAVLALRTGSELGLSGCVDALVTAPVSKEALHLAGWKVEGQTELLARWAGVERYEMVAIAGELRVMLLTRHMPLRDALGAITTERVIDHARLFDETLRGLGIEHPRIALAGLNPHAGEGGILGSEEGELLEPAVRALAAEGLELAGPISPDTVFLAASRGAYDGVLALYHDQGFIPLKLLSADRGVTLVAGLPYLRVSPVHGTAFDIAGKGRASAENLIHALVTAAEWAGSGRGATRGAHSPTTQVS